LLREIIRKPADADRTIEDMVAANPKSGEAIISRWRYRRLYGLAADDNDVAQALRLAPESDTVLLAPAEVAQARNDSAGALIDLEGGMKQSPTNSIFYRFAANLQLSQSHFDKAEEYLRRGLVAIPDKAELLFPLADALLGQGRLEGKNGALDLIKQLQG